MDVCNNTFYYTEIGIAKTFLEFLSQIESVIIFFITVRIRLKSSKRPLDFMKVFNK